MASCEFQGCKKPLTYGSDPQQGRKYCYLHKDTPQVDIRITRCAIVGCDAKPNFGYESEARRFCADHREDSMINLRSRRCKVTECLKYASCGQPNSAPDTCGNHKTNGMVNLVGRRCAEEDCETYASYGTVGVRARYCAKHRKENMVNLTVKQCEHEMCVAQPSFNYKGQRKARFCVKHKHEAMVDVLDRHCKQHGCDRQPIYGDSNKTAGRPLYCPAHRPNDSFDVKTARCQEENCHKHPSYGYDMDRVRRRCRLHKLSDMVDVKSPRCETLGCRKQPCCGHLGAKARFCSEHKLHGMVNLKTRAFRCKHKGPETGESVLMAQLSGRSLLCNRACRFAFPTEPALYCLKHKMDGMVDVLNPRCSMGDCMEFPTHGYEGDQPTFCMTHMATGMKAIVAQSPNIMHWSTEARKQAAATARESSRLLNEREAGSAKVTPLPPKTDPDIRRKMQEAHASAARTIVAARPIEGLSAGTCPLPPPQEEPTLEELALAFGEASGNPLHHLDPADPQVATILVGASAAVAAAAAAAVAPFSFGGGMSMQPSPNYGIPPGTIGGVSGGGLHMAGASMASGYVHMPTHSQPPPVVLSTSSPFPNMFQQQQQQQGAVLTMAPPPPAPIDARVVQPLAQPHVHVQGSHGVAAAGPRAFLSTSAAATPLPALPGIDLNRAGGGGIGAGATAVQANSSVNNYRQTGPGPDAAVVTGAPVPATGPRFGAGTSAGTVDPGISMSVVTSAPAPTQASEAIFSTPSTAMLPAAVATSSVVTAPIGTHGTAPASYRLLLSPLASAAAAAPAVVAEGSPPVIPVVPPITSQAMATPVTVITPDPNQHSAHSAVDKAQPTISVSADASAIVPALVTAPPGVFNPGKGWTFMPTPAMAEGGAALPHAVVPVSSPPPAADASAAAMAVVEGRADARSDVSGAICTTPGCTVLATFGHPGPEKGPTHCLTHCEDGMQRLADDEAGSDEQGAKRRVASAPSTSDEAGAHEQSVDEDSSESSRGKRRKKTNASEGMLLLAGVMACDDDDAVMEDS